MPRCLGSEARDKIRPHLVIGLADGRPQHGDDEERSAPSRSIAATVDSITPVSAPFPPGMGGHDHTRLTGSAKRIGPQSAVAMPSARPGTRVTIASAFGRSATGKGASTVTTSAEWT